MLLRSSLRLFQLLLLESRTASCKGSSGLSKKLNGEIRGPKEIYHGPCDCHPHNRSESIIQNDSCHRSKIDKGDLNLKPSIRLETFKTAQQAGCLDALALYGLLT